MAGVSASTKLVLLFGLVAIAVAQLGLGFNQFPFHTHNRATQLLDQLRSGSLLSDRFPSFPNFPDIPDNCSEAKQSCLESCGSESNMNFQCHDINGVSSSCACASSSGSSPASSNTPRCQAAKQACENKCKGTARFQCSDTGTSYSKSCSCVHPGDEDYEQAVVTGTDMQQQCVADATKESVQSHVDIIPTETREEQEQEDDQMFVFQNPVFADFPSIKMDPFSNHNNFVSTSVSTSSNTQASSGGSTGSLGGVYDDERCEVARRQCLIQCNGMEIDFDCKNEGGTFAKSCSCAGTSSGGSSNKFSSSSSSSSGNAWVGSASSSGVVKEKVYEQPEAL